MTTDTAPITVLIVENDANALHTMRDYMVRAGFQTRAATDGWEALKRIKDGPVDIVIAELELGDIDGSGLREKMLLNPGTRDTPFLYIIPQDKTDVLVRALRSGVDDCITKPFDPVVLVARVQAAIERRQTYEQVVRIDPLTRLLNRPTFEKEIRDELLRIERYKRYAAFVLIDIDGLADINVEGGVALGDLLLTCLAGVILSSIRHVDIAGRTRGQEFIVCLPETDEPGAEILTRRIQKQLEGIADAVANVGLSFCSGIVSAPKDGVAWDVLKPRLDEALRHAKDRGKGSLCVWGKDISESEKTAQTITEI